VSVVNGVLSNAAFSDIERGEISKSEFNTSIGQLTLNILLFLRSAACVSASIPAVLCVRTNCAPQISSFSALYKPVTFLVNWRVLFVALNVRERNIYDILSDNPAKNVV